MNRVKDYLQFAIRFVGLGYIVLWPLTAHDVGITALEAQVVCGGGFFGAPGMNCAASHSIQLSPGLHLLGLVAVICLVAQLLLRRLRRPRRAGAEFGRDRLLAARVTSSLAGKANELAPNQPSAMTGASRPPLSVKTATAYPSVKPRTQFGLRGVPH